MTRATRGAIQCLIVLGFFAAWRLAVSGGMVDPMLLPQPDAVLVRAWHMVQEQSVLRHLGITLAEVLLAIIFVTPVGIAIGLLLGESPYWGKAFKPFFYFMSSVPKSVFLPVFILALGIGFTQKVAFGVFQAIFVLVVSAIAASESVPADYLKTARSFGATRWQLYRHIYLPAMLPILLEGLRLGMIFNITGVLFAEMYVSRSGLGFLIANWGMNFDITSLLAGILLASAMAIVVNETLRWYERRVGAWRA